MGVIKGDTRSLDWIIWRLFWGFRGLKFGV